MNLDWEIWLLGLEFIKEISGEDICLNGPFCLSSSSRSSICYYSMSKYCTTFIKSLKKHSLTYFLQKFIEWFSRQNFSSNALVDVHYLNHFVILFLNTLTTTAFLNFCLYFLHSLLVDAAFVGLFTGQVHANVILETDSALFILDFHIFVQI